MQWCITEQMNEATVAFSQHWTNSGDADERWDIRAKRRGCEWRITTPLHEHLSLSSTCMSPWGRDVNVHHRPVDEWILLMLSHVDLQSIKGEMSSQNFKRKQKQCFTSRWRYQICRTQAVLQGEAEGGRRITPGNFLRLTRARYLFELCPCRSPKGS